MGQVPNALSLLRLVLAILLPWSDESVWIWFVLAAGLSDWLDGWIARRYGAVSKVGGLLDGLSDKAFVWTALVLFARQGWLAWWQVALLLFRDVSVVSGVLVSVARRDRDAFNHMDSRTFGKLATALIFVLLVVLLELSRDGAPAWGAFGFAALLSVAAGIDYIHARFWRVIGRERAAG